MAQVNVRNLEQIQEQDSARPSRIGTLLLVSLAGAAVVTAFVMMSKKGGAPAKSSQDPLAALVADAKSNAAPAEALDGKDVSFPRILSDDATPTTALAAVKDGDVVYDLGCGDGRIVIAAVEKFGAKKGLGIDYNPERVKDSTDAAKKAGSGVENKVTFKQGDVLKMTEKDFDGVDVVTLYLLPEVNRKLKPVLQKGLKPGARVVSHDFDMGDDWKPEKTANVTDDRGVEHTVYLWTIKEKK